MRFVIVVLVSLFLLVELYSCFDREQAVRNASGREIDEDSRELTCAGDPPRDEDGRGA